MQFTPILQIGVTTPRSCQGSGVASTATSTGITTRPDSARWGWRCGRNSSQSVGTNWRSMRAVRRIRTAVVAVLVVLAVILVDMGISGYLVFTHAAIDPL